MRYKMVVNLDRNVVEQYTIEVEAPDPEEAQDIAYNFFIDFPDASIPINRMIRNKQDTTSSEVIDITFEREVDVADKVFNDDGDDVLA